MLFVVCCWLWYIVMWCRLFLFGVLCSLSVDRCVLFVVSRMFCTCRSLRLFFVWWLSFGIAVWYSLSGVPCCLRLFVGCLVVCALFVVGRFVVVDCCALCIACCWLFFLEFGLLCCLVVVVYCTLFVLVCSRFMANACDSWFVVLGSSLFVVCCMRIVICRCSLFVAGVFPSGCLR